MEVKIEKGLLKVTHKLKKGETYKVSSGKFNSVSIYRKPQVVKGVASYCEDGKHVLFIDYDNVPLWLVKQDYKRLQEQFSIPQGYLFTTKEEDWQGDKVGNYHVICLIKLLPQQIYKILATTHADVNYMSMPLRRVYRNWVLRISNKRRKGRPEAIGLIGEAVNLDTETSRAHLDLLNRLYKIPEINYQNKDDLKKVFLQEYEAS